MNCEEAQRTIAQCSEETDDDHINTLLPLNLRETSGPIAQCTETPHQQDCTSNRVQHCQPRDCQRDYHGPIAESRGPFAQCTEAPHQQHSTSDPVQHCQQCDYCEPIAESRGPYVQCTEAP